VHADFRRTEYSFAVKWIGAAYLVYFRRQCDFGAPTRFFPAVRTSGKPAAERAGGFFRERAFVPADVESQSHIVFFFSAIFAQFIDPAPRPSFPQIVILGLDRR